MRRGSIDRFGVGAALAALAVGAPARVYGAENIERMIRKHGRSRQVGNSIADQPHDHKREIARRARQATRNAERQRLRYVRQHRKFVNAEKPATAIHGVSRRGRLLDIAPLP